MAKTTTTELTTAMLQGSGVRTMASGNIGLPFATAVRQSNELDVMVLEVSSFQLETIDAFHPHVSVWLNLSPNHLDRYRDMDEYRTAKLRIFAESDIGGLRGGQRPREPSPARRPANHLQRLRSGCGLFSARWNHHYRNEPVLDQRRTNLPGVHNAENLMAAMGVGLALGLDFERMSGAVGEYTARSTVVSSSVSSTARAGSTTPRRPTWILSKRRFSLNPVRSC